MRRWLAMAVVIASVIIAITLIAMNDGSERKPEAFRVPCGYAETLAASELLLDDIETPGTPRPIEPIDLELVQTIAAKVELTLVRPRSTTPEVEPACA